MIPCANPLAQYQSHKDEILDAVKRVLEGGNYVLGPEVVAFEKTFSAYCGVEHGIGVNSGTDALIITLRALNIGPGDEVITVSHTALATVAAIAASGATPVLVDIDPVYYTIDPEHFQRAISAKTKAVIPVHLYGQPADMDAIMTIAHEHGLFVIEDCAQAAGATFKGCRVGSIGDAGCFSFYPTKNLGAIGDGGMVVTRNAKLAARLRRLRQYGWDESRITDEPGLNSRLDEIQAAILNVKFKSLDVDNARRRAIAQLYNEDLAGLPVALPKERPDTMHVYHLYVIRSEERDRLKEGLKNNRITAGVHYPLPVHQHRGYGYLQTDASNELPVSSRLAGQVLSLPLFPELNNSEVLFVINAMRGFHGSRMNNA